MNNYPLFSSLFPKIILPDNIGFLKGSEDQINQTLESILSEFLYRYIQIHTSASSDSAFYGFELLTKDRLSLEIPGTNGLALLINPSQNLDLTAIPITFSYQWPILRYVSQFNYQFFGGTINQYTDLLLQIVGISQRSFINQAIFAFSNDVQDPIGDFIILVNRPLY